MTAVNIWKPEDNIPREILAILSKPHPNYQLAFLNIIQLLKTQRRTGWVDHGIDPCESISDHMYRMGLTTMLITDKNVDRNKCIRIALVHDFAESLVGDITPNDPMTKEEKHRREFETVKYLCESIIRPCSESASREILDDWLAYEKQTCLEGRYVKDIDKYEMLVQCFEYEQKYNGKKDLKQFWGAINDIKTDEVKKWTQSLLEDRQAFFDSLKE
ncbi:YGL101W-like protein [Saccharomyces cerevisiae]|jgi:putative hydrolase of HD superfamily|uniref:5'-deoxynucleotidase n=7 Tax=Saccharomyces TaxID=4930 RepID=G2WDZ8_YEASK|nr:hypothetical protein H779_YJM993G00157 [Saccharomyces cerevisiae YJM993]AJP38697.1 hypothetical protein F842_YJM1078G00153 [Saccharomyces cerevisiae YJM1078]AJR76018.1 hypothetical protein H747_YJM189G00157 [Saccharomyces cerevisiae YJM189]AJR77514.1 hypothetical protein H750_YJM244G00157 [Saccharomyces cerevisiae YJM244]AJR78018.1 hypothetical protein H751_YJM248G00157 [Saccharomyces cerevisiae YJM248]AJR78503.1 hypothetical protein H752_YJM270G00157 [Saccharomyces cerevisiae YJM270]AJR79